LYITCSVFEKENESVAQFIAANLGAQLVEQKIIEGYTQKADTMFAALFQF
jgi:16S rRNA (cytosine967-C5)-methyltransferase